MDWQRFLEENNIHYVTRGPNTKRGEFSINCPFCGDEDPSEHLGINPKTGNWGCHRDQAHRGKSAKRLIRAILSCSGIQAGFILKQYDQADPDSLESIIGMLTEEPTEPAPPPKQHSLDAEFAKFAKICPRGSTKRFFNYLQTRGYDNPQDIISNYDLRCALVGKYHDRVILPIRMNGQLLGWTSRAIIDPANAPRYLASSNDVKTTVFNYDEIKKGGDVLYILEGPFDALRVDSHLAYVTHGDRRATCVFGTSVTISQVALLRAVVKRFKIAYVLFDQGADNPSIELASWLGNARAIFLPSNVKDPDDLLEADLDDLCCASIPTATPFISALVRSTFDRKMRQSITRRLR